ncbi:MAG: hypothetical protein ACJ78Q_03370 [Chloroflexia bacterium]
MSPAVHQERIYIVAALVTAGLGLQVAVGRGLITGAASPQLGVAWLMVLAVTAVAAAGSGWATRPPQAAEPGALPVGRLPLVRLPLDIVVPSLLAAGLALFVQLFENGLLQGAIVVLGGFVFGAVLWAQSYARYVNTSRFALAQTALNVISHLTAFLFFSVIYGLKLRSSIAAPAVGVVAALLLFELLSRDAAWHKAMSLPVASRRTTVGWLALAGGLVAGELTWGLNYWAALSTLIGGAFLLVVFYILHGLASSYVDRRLGRQVILEYSAVGAIAVAVVLVSAFVS